MSEATHLEIDLKLTVPANDQNLERALKLSVEHLR